MKYMVYDYKTGGQLGGPYYGRKWAERLARECLSNSPIVLTYKDDVSPPPNYLHLRHKDATSD